MNIRRLTLGLAACAALGGGGGLVAFSTPAFGAGEFALERSFGTSGSGNGDFEGPANAAVQQSTGDLFVADPGNRRLQVFAPSGAYLTQFGGAEIAADGGAFSSEVVGVAVDNSGGVSAGDVYVADLENRAVDKFKPRGPSPSEGYEYVCQLIGPGGGCHKNPVEEHVAPTEAFDSPGPSSVAVDARGNLYISQYEGPVEEFDAAGNYIATLGPTILFTSDISVNASGSAIYVANLFGQVVKLVVEPISHTVVGEVELAEEGVFAAAVDQATGNLFVDHNSVGVNKYEERSTRKAGEEPLEEFGGKGEISGESSGIEYSAHGNGEVYVTDHANDDVHIFTPEPSGLRPEVTCTTPQRKAKTATLSCAITPQGGDANALWHMEYKEAGSHGSPEWTNVPGGEVTSAGEVEQTITGLNPETRYVYRAVASNTHGELTSGRVGFLTTAAVPGVTKCAASNETGEGATLAASLEPTEAGAEYHFNYGTSESYGSSTETKTLASAGEAEVKEAIKGLEPNTTYDCQLLAKGSEGDAPGPNGAFKTVAVPPAVNDRPPSASAITRTTAVLNATINPEKSPTEYHFVYVAAAHYDSAAKNPYYAGAATPEASAGEGFGDEPVNPPQINGLRAGTPYDYALVASNEADKASPELGPNYTFTTAPGTPPEVGAAAASEVNTTSVLVSDTINPRGLLTSYEFELGTDTTYSGAKMFGQVAPGNETITLNLEDLAPATVYHYRFIASNEDGAAEGPDQTFTTPGITSPLIQPLAVLLIATPNIAFPMETGTATMTATKALTRVQKLAAALKACRTKKKGKRATCERRARKQYAPAKAEAKTKHNSRII